MSSGFTEDTIEGPHRRYNALTQEWVLVSTGRTTRPWLGAEEDPSDSELPEHDPDCYLCPRSNRANAQVNPDYEATFVFDNDFPALRDNTQNLQFNDRLFAAHSQRGKCRVVCFSPRHDLTLANMPPEAVRKVVDTWAEESSRLGTEYTWVQVFENRGEMMGASNPHPHGQIWAVETLPVEANKEDKAQLAYGEETGSNLLLDYGDREAGGPREVVANDYWQVVVPFWATWPFETMVLPRTQIHNLADTDDKARNSLVSILKELLANYDNLFRRPFPYSMGWHEAPYWDEPRDHWVLHGHFYPPLLRSAGVRKFMVGYELLAEPQRDITPEEAAARLRSARPGEETEGWVADGALDPFRVESRPGGRAG